MLRVRTSRSRVFLFFFSICSYINAQDLSEIKGKVLDLNRNPIENIEIVLKDSEEKIVNQTFTDESGYYYFYVQPNSYTLQVVDYDKILYTAPIRIDNSIVLENIAVYYSNITNLEEVIIKVKKPIVKNTNDGFKLNIKGTKLEQKGNALDVLKYAPNVSTRNGIEILGNKNYIIIFNGKELHLDESQRLLFLESLKSDNIKNIEVIDRPDASIPSEVAAVLKIQSFINDGVSATLSTSASHNDFLGNTNSIDLFYGTNKYRIYSSFYNSRKKTEFSENSTRLIDNYDYDINKTGRLDREEWNVVVGGDFYIDSLKTIGFLYDFIIDNDNNFETHSEYDVTSSTNPNLSKIIIDNLFEHKDLEHTFTLDYNQILDSLGSSLSGSLNYFFNKYKVPFKQDYQEIYAVGSDLFEKNEQNSNDNKNLYGIKLDWNKVKKNSNLKIGAKYAYNTNTDTFNYNDNSDDELILNNELSNKFNYDENNTAFYSSYRYNFKKSTLILGTRFEYKEFDFDNNENLKVSNNFFNFIPTLYYKINNVYFYFTKRLRYPGYYNYNPNLVKINDTEFSRGNPDLQPIQTYILQAGYNFKKKYSLTIQYGYTETHIYNLKSNFNDGSSISMLTNGGYHNYGRLYVNVPVKLFDWWKTINKLNFNYNDFYVPRVSSEDYKGFGMGIESSHSFYLSEDIELSIDVNHNTENYSLYTSYIDNFSTGLHLKIPVFKNSRFNISLNDVFNTLHSGYQYDFNGVSFKTKSKYNTRTLTVGFTNNLSKGKEIDESYKESDIEKEKDNIKQ